MPFPTEHSARQEAPDLFRSYRRWHPEQFPAGIDAVGGRREGSDSIEIQTIRFDASKWTPAQAKAWLKEQGFKTGDFVKTSGESAAQRMESATYGKSGRTKSVTGIASVAVFGPGGRLLMGKRKDDHRWTLPGGHLELGESPEDGATRELAEEAGIRGAPLTYLGTGTTETGYQIHAYCAYDVTQTPSAASDPDDEVGEWAWIDVKHGLPERIRGNLHAPKNVTLHLLGLGSAEGLTAIESARTKMDRSGSGSLPTGVWDQGVLFGEYQHVTVDDKPVQTIFDASKCRFMLDDFQSRKNDIFWDRRHEVVDVRNAEGRPLSLDEMDQWARGTTGAYGLGEGDGKALAWSDAMCMTVAGQVVKYVRHSTAPENPPTIEELRRSDGNLPEDGVYLRRSTVTPLGEDPKEGLAVFRYGSPYFVPMRDGWRLLNMTATNDPRMEGVALAYERGGRVAMQRVPTTMRPTARSAMERHAMAHMPDMTEKEAPSEHAAIMAAAGCMEGDTPDMKLAKMAAYARKMEMEARKMEEARKAEEGRKGEDESASKMEEEEARKGEVRKASRRMEGEDKPFAGKESPAEELAEHKELQGLLGRMAALEEKNEMLSKELMESRSSMKRFAKMEEDSKAMEAQTFARTAIAMGRVKGDHKGSLEATEKWLAAKYVKSPSEAEDVLSGEGTYQISERFAMTRLTSGGSGIGAPAPRADLEPGAEVDQLIAAEIKSLQAAKTPGDLTTIAMQRVSKKNPAAWARYANRNA